MVYIEIAAIIIFSIVSYLSLKKLLLAKFKKLDDDYLIMLTSALDSKSKELDVKQSTSLLSAKQDLSKENELYLSRMNKDISKQLKELSDNVKNKRII
jgi:hypothetical protein